MRPDVDLEHEELAGVRDADELVERELARADEWARSQMDPWRPRLALRLVQVQEQQPDEPRESEDCAPALLNGPRS